MIHHERQGHDAKELELRSELEKRNPDVKRAASLQKDLSELQAEYDQKQIEYRIKLREIDPYLGSGMRQGPRGGERYDGGGPGYCWR